MALRTDAGPGQGEGGGDDVDALCDLSGRVAQATEQLRALAEAGPPAQRAEWMARARYLLAQSRLWLTEDREQALDLLRAIARDAGSPGAAQNARLFVMLLAIIDDRPAELRMALAQMLADHRRPPLSVDGGSDALHIDLIGGALIFGEPLISPVPEVLCGIRALYPDYLAPDLSAALAVGCRQRPVDPRIERYLAHTAESLSRLTRRPGCAE
jgi:hypothetical protein